MKIAMRFGQDHNKTGLSKILFVWILLDIKPYDELWQTSFHIKKILQNGLNLAEVVQNQG